MNTVKQSNLVINPPDFKDAIKQEKDFFIQFHQVTGETEALVTRIIHRYLQEYDILYIKDTILTIVKELINNAVKANLKRLYFKLKNLDIDKIDDYRTGMETFKDETYQEDIMPFLEKLEHSNLVVRVAFKTSEEHIHINVINNIPILDQELNKINARVTKAYKYEDISEAFEDVLDDSEGAGLGLIMAMMLFRNTGLGADNFKIYKKENLTITTLTIPKILTPQGSRHEITERILKEIDEIPAFPDNITEIQKLCSIPDTPIKNIADSISRDPGLTTSILKLANSAGYLTIRKVDTIEEAVMKIGMKGINTLLVASGVFKIIDSRYKRFEKLWKNSYKRAYYAQKLCAKLQQPRISDFAYLAALLADIGNMVLLAIDEELIGRLKTIGGFKGIDDSNLLEEISLGLSHSTLGAMIGKKWKFNEALTTAIELHNRPHMAPDHLKHLVYIVYLSNVMVDIENRKTRFEIIDEDVLEEMNLTEKETFETIHQKLKDSYKGEG